MAFTVETIDPFDVLKVTYIELGAGKRGYNMVLANPALYEVIGTELVQWNYTHSEQATVRGMHLQVPPAAQGKLVFPVWGNIFDAWIDLRPDSDTYLQTGTCVLDRQKGMTALYIPEGYAHGFMTPHGSAQVIYGLSRLYSPKHERSIHYKSCGIEWPIKGPAHISEKDETAPTLDTFAEPALPFLHG